MFTSTPRWAAPGQLAQNLEAPADEQIPRQKKQASVGSGSTSICMQHWMLIPGLWGASCSVGLEPTHRSRLLSSGVTTKFNPSSATCWTCECTWLSDSVSPSSITTAYLTQLLQGLQKTQNVEVTAWCLARNRPITGRRWTEGQSPQSPLLCICLRSISSRLSRML